MGIGWLALNSWLGIGFLIVGVILLIGLGPSWIS